MATTQYTRLSREYHRLMQRENNRLDRHTELEGNDPFDRATDHDDDETDDYALYRLGLK
jgi:hypothetical protein